MATFIVTADRLNEVLTTRLMVKKLDLPSGIVPTLVKSVLNYYTNLNPAGNASPEYMFAMTEESLWEVLNNSAVAWGFNPVSSSAFDSLVDAVFSEFTDWSEVLAVDLASKSEPEVIGYGIKDVVTGNYIFPCTCKTEGAARKLKAAHFPSTQYVIVKLAEAGKLGGNRG